jgi:hypothetical protein
MYNLRAKISLLTVIGIIILTLSSCIRNKSEHCKKMSVIQSQTALASKEFLENSKEAIKAKDINGFIQKMIVFKTKLEGSGKKMQALEIKDRELKVIQEQLVAVRQENISSLEKTMNAIKTKNPILQAQAKDEMKNAAIKEQTIVTEMNTYCAAK